MKYIIATLLFVLGVSAQAQTNLRTVMVNTNGVIQRPTNLFTANRILSYETNGNVVYTNTNTLKFTNNVTFYNITTSGTLAVTGNATFVTNVSIGGTLTVGSLVTTDPVGWVLDSLQIAADTNGVLALPDAANVLRITNTNTISAINNGRLGAFYFLINQSGTNLVISNSATITARGATNLTLGANQSATLISTTTTNATIH